MIRQGAGGGYRVVFWGGPLDGEIRQFAVLSDELELYWGPGGVVTDELVYRRASDGPANPWRYVFVSQERHDIAFRAQDV